MPKKDLFIKTSDKETADLLVSQGFKLINEINGVFTFANNSKLNFNNTKNVVYTNIFNV